MGEQNKNKLIRSSTAEFLTFVASGGKGSVEAVYADETVWLTQKMMGLLYDVDIRTISHHLKKVFSDGELDENSVIQYFRITAADGKSYNTQHCGMPNRNSATSSPPSPSWMNLSNLPPSTNL